MADDADPAAPPPAPAPVPAPSARAPHRPGSPHTRDPHWVRLLHEFIESRRRTPFRWGEQDCCTFAADAVRALTGVDPIADLRGTYATEAEADAVLAAHGGLEAMAVRAAQAAGLPEGNPTLAHRGDIALVRNGNQMLLGVLTGVHVAVPGMNGLHFVRRSMITRAWSV